MGKPAPVANSEEKNAGSTGDKSAVAPSQPDPVYQRMQSKHRATAKRDEN
jgi:hypothetical protein